MLFQVGSLIWIWLCLELIERERKIIEIGGPLYFSAREVPDITASFGISVSVSSHFLSHSPLSLSSLDSDSLSLSRHMSLFSNCSPCFTTGAGAAAINSPKRNERFLSNSLRNSNAISPIPRLSQLHFHILDKLLLLHLLDAQKVFEEMFEPDEPLPYLCTIF